MGNAAIQLLILIPAGFLTGVIAALFGVGGGAIYVPLIFALIRSQGASVDAAMKIGIGTSLFTMFFTTFSAGTGHWRRGNYVRRAAPALIVSGLMCSFIGARLGVALHGETLKSIFAAILLIVAARTVVKVEARESEEPINNVVYFAVIGALSGVVSSLIGVGGGVVLVPALTLLLRQPFLKSVGTSSVVIIFTSFIGAVTYITAPRVAVGHALIFGHVNLLFASALIPSGIVGAWAGVRIASHSPTRILKPLFAAFMFLVAIDMLGLPFGEILKWIRGI